MNKDKLEAKRIVVGVFEEKLREIVDSLSDNIKNTSTLNSTKTGVKQKSASATILEDLALSIESHSHLSKILSYNLTNKRYIDILTLVLMREKYGADLNALSDDAVKELKKKQLI